MDTAVAFGKNKLLLTLPDGPIYQILRAQSARSHANAREEIDSALDSPIGGAPLSEVAAGKKTAAIVVCDITRPARNATTLPPVLEQLHRAGISPAGVTIIIVPVCD